MVFVPEGQFQQFPHCKFRENVVRLLYIPSIYSIQNNGRENTSKEQNGKDHPSHYFLSINKFGKVGLYHPETFSLVHTYCLDLSVPMHPHVLTSSSKVHHQPVPKCERTHLVIDAAYAPDAICLIFATTKNLLQWYDIGEIQQQNIGLELFPRKEFMGLCETSFPLLRIPNQGHVESHRLFGLPFMPTCLEYFSGDEKSKGRLFIGDVDGGISIISILNPRYPLGRRKIRGKLHKIMSSHLMNAGFIQYYKGHHQPVTDIYFLSERDLVLSCSKDRKFSVFVKDMKETVDSIIVSITKGVNTLAYSGALKMIATGSDDHVVRLFSQFIMKMPQMELFGHRSAVLTVQFAEVDVSIAEDAMSNMESDGNPTLLFSYSTDSELRAWDPLTFICLQSLYFNFPIGSTIICKTPEFARKSLIIHQPFELQSSTPEKHSEGKPEKVKNGKSGKRLNTSKVKRLTQRKRMMDSGTIILLYCNSYARINLEKGRPSKWPFDYDQFIQEFEELSTQYDKKLKEKLKGPSALVPARTDIDDGGEGEDEDTAKKYENGNLMNKQMAIIEEERGEIVNYFPGLAKEEHQEKKLSQEELNDVELKLDVYVKEILKLKQTIKDNEKSISNHRRGNLRKSDSRGNHSKIGTEAGLSIIEDDEDETPAATGREAINISVRATDKFYEFKKAKEKNLPKSLERMISYGQAFNHYPLMELEPISFTRRNLVVSEEMKKILGIGAMNSIQDLLTPQAQSYFGIDLQKSGSRFFPAKKPQKKKTDKPGQKHDHFQGEDVNPFAVIGRKMRNAYEDDVEFTGEDEDVGRGGMRPSLMDRYSGGRYDARLISNTNSSTLMENDEEEYDFNDFR